MPALANTFRTANAVGNREDLANEVSMITPEDTPIFSSIRKEKATKTNTEFEMIELNPPGDNAQLEGDEYSFAASTPAVRLQNWCQIFSKTGLISGSQDASDNAGGVEKTENQKLMRGVELRRDVEWNILNNGASLGTDPRRSGGLPSWYTANVSRGGGGANGGFSAGTRLTVAATNGTQRAFTKAQLDDTLRSAYTAGGNPRMVVMSPYAKQVFVGFMSDPAVVAFRQAVNGGSGNTLVANVEYYHGPNGGRVAIVTNRVQTTAALARNVHVLDPSVLAWKWYRRIQEDKNIAKTGDAKKFVIIGEGCLAVKNERACGVVADIFGVSPTA